MALTDKLTNIANAIRSKTGSTDALTLEQMVAEIEGISTGGGSSGGGSEDSGIKIAYGSFTTTEKIDVTHPNYYRIEHNLGEIPIFTMVTRTSNELSANTFRSVLTYAPSASEGNNRIFASCAYGLSNGGSINVSKGLNGTPDENSMYAGLLGLITTCSLEAAEKYIWVAIAGVTV